MFSCLPMFMVCFVLFISDESEGVAEPFKSRWSFGSDEERSRVRYHEPCGSFAWQPSGDPARTQSAEWPNDRYAFSALNHSEASNTLLEAHGNEMTQMIYVIVGFASCHLARQDNLKGTKQKRLSVFLWIMRIDFH